MEKTSVCVAVVALVVVVLATPATAGYGPYGGYSTPRPVEMEPTVRNIVQRAIDKYPSVGAALVRLLFHDCWVNGCDGSVLLDSTPYGELPEKKASSNIGLGGFDVIDAIKGELGDKVSCADILVFAARDATSILSGDKIYYEVYPGRKDGVRSSAAEADKTLPGPTFTFQELKQNFKYKNFTQEELVILSGAHSIGVAHYESFKDRLEPKATPIDPKYKMIVRQQSADHSKVVKNNIRDMDRALQTAAGYNANGVNTAPRPAGMLDNSYYTANLQNMVLFRSDWELRNDATGEAEKDLIEYRDNATLWNDDFAKAMAKLSDLKPPKDQYVEIRKKCSCTNPKY